MSNYEINKICSELIKGTHECRREILSMLETEFYGDPKWLLIRSRLLGFLGDRGLEGKIRKVMNPNNFR